MPDLDAIRARAKEATDYKGLNNVHAVLGHDALALLAEIERLREALHRIANPIYVARTEEGAAVQIDVEQIARAALAQEPEAHRTKEPSP